MRHSSPMRTSSSSGSETIPAESAWRRDAHSDAPSVELEDVGLRFVKYHDKHYSLKRAVLDLLLQRENPRPVSEFWALQGLNLQLRRGERLGVIGPNGAGKSTLLKIIARILTSYHGEVHLAERSLKKLSSRRLASLIGYVPQLFSAEFPHTVNDFVLMGLYSQLGRFSPVSAVERQQVQAALALTGTSELAGRILQTLSGGERQRVLIAAALVHNPQLLLLDEPTTFLDPKHEFEVEALLREIRSELGITIIAVTHNLNLCALHSDVVLALRDGKVAFFGTPRDLMQVHVLQEIYDHRFDLLLHPRHDFNMIVPRAT